MTAKADRSSQPSLRSTDKQLAADPDYPFPVGVEYYRAPVPPQQFWDGDFARIRAAGMRIVRSFTFWNWLEPQSGQFEFDDFDRFFDLAQNHDLKVWIDITIATHGTCPEWMLRMHPDMRVLWFDGQVQQDTAGDFAPQGVMVHNYDHPKWREYAERFIRALVGRYKDHPSLLIWGTCDGVNLSAAWAGGGGYPPYNDYTIEKYLNWLKGRFTLDQLNERLLRRYRSWDDVQPPRSNSAPVDMSLYKQFHYENMADMLGWMADLIDRIDGQHEQRSHGARLPRPWDEMAGERVDGWGLSFPTSGILSDPAGPANIYFGFDWSRAVGRRGRWWCEEIYAGPHGHGLLAASQKQSKPEELTTMLWLSLTAGAAGALFWQYRPEYMSFEAPGLNLTSFDGRPTARLEAVETAIREIDTLKEHLPLEIPPAEVAVGYSGPSHEILTYARVEGRFLDGLTGLYRTLWENSIPRNIVTPRMDWSQYKLVYLPNFAVLDATALKKLRLVLDRCPQTHVIAAGHFGSFSEKGHWSYRPPEGLDDVVPIRLVDFESLTSNDIRQGHNVLKTEYGEFAITNECEYAILDPQGNTKAIAWLNGEVVAVETPGRRLAWWGLPPERGLEQHDLLQLIGSYGVQPPFSIKGDRVIAFRRLSRLGGSLIFLLNLGTKTAQSQIKPSWHVDHLIDLLSKKPVDRTDDGYSLDVPPRSVKVLYGKPRKPDK